MASAAPHFSAKTQSDEPSPIQLPSATSNNCTNVLPISLRTHSSKIAQRKIPYCSDSTLHGVTIDEFSFSPGNGGAAKKQKARFYSSRGAPTHNREKQDKKVRADL